MLDVAIRHKEALVERFRSVWFEDKYKFWNYSNYFEEWSPEESTWINHQFASLNKQGEVIGYIGYRIDRASELVYSLNIINFTEDKATFGMDCGQAIRDIFEKYHFRKINFSVVVGNPIEESYDRMIKRYGGSVCGYQRKNAKLIDGQLYDEKLYEIFQEDYIKSRDKTLNTPKTTDKMGQIERADKVLDYSPKAIELAIEVIRNELLKHGDLYKGFMASIESPFREAGVNNLDVAFASERILKRIIGEEG